MLQINVLRELRQRIGSVSEYEIQEPSLLVDDVRIRDIQGSATLLRTDRGLLATVRVQGKMDAPCSRCVANAQADVAVEFKEEYVPMVEADTGSPGRLPPDNDDTFRIDNRFDLDLREALRQYILISEPVSPLCREDCAGLCPECGADLNAGPHQCEQPPDERWSALTGLKSEIQEGN
jgi:uncharacterized protein